MSPGGLRAYLLLSAVLFGLIAFAHLLRLVNGWTLVLGPWSVPVWISWGGFAAPALLCAWATGLAARRRS